MAYDEEKKLGRVASQPADSGSELVGSGGSGMLDRLLSLEATMDSKLGIESQAIQRVRPEDKRPQSWHEQATMALLWAGATMNVSCLSTGFLGWEFGLDLGQTIPVTIFGTLLGASVAGWCATLGPGTGLRQMSISRYSFGWYPSKILAALNVISQIGWSAVGSITAGSALSAVSDGRLGSIVGIVIIAVCSSALNFCGLRAILEYQKYAWAVFFVLFMIMYGEMAPRSDVATKSTLTGNDKAGAVLSLLAVVYGSSVSWATIAADYYVQHPINTSKVKVFTLTTMGIGISTCVGMVLGCCVGSAMGADQELADVYEEQGVGFLIQTMLFPRGFAKFVLIVLVLAGIGMNCINLYSSALSVQQFARPLARIPRFVWTVVLFGITLAIAAGGRESLNAYLQNFLSLLGYWATSFFVILWCEHYLFRRGSCDNYDLEAWNDPSKLPLGLAALVAFLVGVVGWVLGMVQTWFTGPIGQLLGGAGGDLANELTFVFTLVFFVPLRWLELKYIGR
ncbi:putative nucleoside [Diaporthe ampelina]|uniref:Putative nucleoside n=1 Tax=Diaporthe ampelina TaxID=1214573 RepID=A0A0G2FTZ1_9PEZI|nr:putative nucleoside [Diaporthe ampelina]